MNLTKQEVKLGKKFINDLLKEDYEFYCCSTYAEIILNTIYQDHPYLKVILEREGYITKTKNK